ncbi:subclass B1 metallo-beta-lactamase [Chryseobacterium arthrosphaerae]|uniref:subclass B1 metallo-beta-lactamase n=1 Tax=Chryseobacterium arthrosphaerae TaxID=651561 RepID=UPI002015F9B2|nr:subclass B1 metallo-beta-lactamase [Chryseobacterium arthrosphaerae]MCO5238383.1 subclass B1 metallo-beta-lactamase [Chitinophagaceae bacterium]
MNIFIKTLFIILCFTIFSSCSSQKKIDFKPKGIYKTNDLVVTQISENAFTHISYLQTNDFGNVPCNGLIVRDNNEVIIFDSPTNDKSAEELIKWVKETLNCKINAIIPTHFHDDCLGGLKAFNNHNIPSYAYFKTIELARENKYEIPKNSFDNSITLKVGTKNVSVKFFGEGHTKDNVVGYFPSENIMFGGCLIKELNAGKGYLGDANIAEWSNTVEKVKMEYLNVKIVVPGHGEYGNSEILDYTIKLFKTE